MKTAIALFLVFISTSFFSIGQETGHIGIWSFDDDGQIIKIELDDKGFVTFRSEEEIFGGEPHVDEDGSMVWATYRVDYSTSPHSIVLISHIEDGEETESYEAPGLFELLDGGKKMRLMVNFDDEIYPTEFNDEDAVIATKVD